MLNFKSSCISLPCSLSLLSLLNFNPPPCICKTICDEFNCKSILLVLKQDPTKPRRQRMVYEYV